MTAKTEAGPAGWVGNWIGRALGLLSFALLTACGGLPSAGEGDEPAAKKTTESVIDGVDTRLNYGDHTEPGLMNRARWSTAAMMPSSRINGTPPAITFNAPTLKQVHNLCDGQPFAGEQTAADCAATLIDDDLVITAGHCISAQTCADTRFVFGYWLWQDPGTFPTSMDVYSCQSIVVSQSSPADYAIVRLNRPVVGPSPVRVRSNRASLTEGLPILSVGFPDGTPAKLSAGNMVTFQDPNVLVTNVDAFTHSDGAGQYTDTYELAGVLTNPTQGTVDYVAGPAGSTPAGCNVPQICSQVGCGANNADAGFYVGAALDAYCALDPNNPRLCRYRMAQAYSDPNPLTPREQMLVDTVFLEPGATIDFGTCVTPGSSSSGDTYVALLDATLNLVTDNDNGGGSCGLAAHANYTVPNAFGGMYELIGGCGNTTACSGTIGYTISGPTGGSFAYSASNTNSASTATRDVSISLRAGETLTAGTCGLEDTSFTGDTYVRLFQGATQLAVSDDACGGLGSQLSYTAPSATTVTLKSGCYSNGACDARAAYRIGVSSMAFSATNTNSNTQNSVTRTVHLLTGDKLTVGTCGLQDATFNGDTVVSVYSGTTAVATNDDACGYIGSRISYRAPSTGDYSVHLGCFGSSTCSGNAVFAIRPQAAVNGWVPFSTSNTNSATAPSVHQQFYLRAGDIFSTGTCPSIPSASGTGDTFIRLYSPTGADSFDSDDNCSTGSSLLSAINGVVITPETAGSYLLHMGCYGSGACSGTEGYVLQ